MMRLKPKEIKCSFPVNNKDMTESAYNPVSLNPVSLLQMRCGLRLKVTLFTNKTPRSGIAVFSRHYKPSTIKEFSLLLLVQRN